MYEVTIDGVTSQVPDENVVWVRFKQESGAWVKTTEDKAEAVAVNSEIYNLEGHNLVTVPKAFPATDGSENMITVDYTPTIIKISKVQQ